jgi:hypothetical protein
MPRKRRETTKADTNQTEVSATFSPPPSAAPRTLDESVRGDTSQPDQAATTSRARGRSFKATLSLPAKGVTLGERNGHDWVISFPADPGKETTDKLRDAGFEYRDRKWKVFTHAANRAQVEALAKELKRQHCDDASVHDYPTRQVVLAFEAPPGDDVTSRLKEAGFHFRSDLTWNADFSPENQKIARDLIHSLPDQSRSAVAGR